MDKIVSGEKKCEIRLNDRDFQKDDTLRLWDDSSNQYRFYKIIHIHSGYGMAPNFVCLSIVEMRRT